MVDRGLRLPMHGGDLRVLRQRQAALGGRPCQLVGLGGRVLKHAAPGVKEVVEVDLEQTRARFSLMEGKAARTSAPMFRNSQWSNSSSTFSSRGVSGTTIRSARRVDTTSVLGSTSSSPCPTG